jgi:hypothetical protein
MAFITNNCAQRRIGNYLSTKKWCKLKYEEKVKFLKYVYDEQILMQCVQLCGDKKKKTEFSDNLRLVYQKLNSKYDPVGNLFKKIIDPAKIGRDRIEKLDEQCKIAITNHITEREREWLVDVHNVEEPIMVSLFNYRILLLSYSNIMNQDYQRVVDLAGVVLFNVNLMSSSQNSKPVRFFPQSG